MRLWETLIRREAGTFAIFSRPFALATNHLFLYLLFPVLLCPGVVKCGLARKERPLVFWPVTDLLARLFGLVFLGQGA
jgi:hypothetical protein